MVPGTMRDDGGVLTDAEIIVAFGTIAVLGIGAQWVGRLFGFPSLLLLLPAGLLAGDVLGFVDPVGLFGDTLPLLATLLVALLLFQSGLELRITDLPGEARSPVYRLVTVGVAITFVGASLAASVIVGLDEDLAMLLGAIVVVSGPTVVGPLLGVVRPREPIGVVLRYEGAFLDPIGATLGVVVLNLVLAADRGGVHPIWQGLARLGVGVLAGSVAAALLVFVLSRYWVPDNMEAAVGTMFAVAAFAAAEATFSEAGLFATLALGVALASQSVVSVGRVRAFGETLEVLIIASLFILLGAIVPIDELLEYWDEILLMVAALVLVVRPVTVAVALLGTRLAWVDRAMIAWVDPRGIVAASTAAAFTVSLAAADIESDFLLPMVFGVILGTGVTYGLTAKLVARRLGVVEPPPRGVYLIGDSPWLFDIARCLDGTGVDVLVGVPVPPVDAAAHADRLGIPVVSVLDHAASHRAFDDADVAVVADCSRPGLSQPTMELIERFGRRNVLRLPSSRASADIDLRLPRRLSERPFAPGLTFEDIDELVAGGATVRTVVAGDRSDVLPLAIVSSDGRVDLRPAGRMPVGDECAVGLVGAGVATARSSDRPTV